MRSSTRRLATGLVCLLLVPAATRGAVTDLVVLKSGSDVALEWTSGTAPYRVLRSQGPRFVSGNANVAIGVATGVAVDSAGLIAPGSAYYLVLGGDDSNPPLFESGDPSPACPTASEGMPQLDGDDRPLRGQDTVCTLAHGFGTWWQMPGVPAPSQACQDLHDSFWVNGYDGDRGTIYHTWHAPIVAHPVSGEVCSFGHDHGDDPSSSALFEYAGGWPAFGYAAEQFSKTRPPGLERHEDHVGHKVTAATYRASIGNPPNHDWAVYDAGFYCHFLSKIHQGSHSVDALTNQLHEYFIAVRCDDNPLGLIERMEAPADARLADPGNVRTEFSIKLMMPFGLPDQFGSGCGGNVDVPAGNAFGFGGAPLDPSANPDIAPVEASNPRGIGCFNEWQAPFRYGTPDSITELDLWTQPTSVAGPAWATRPSLAFQAYYIVKDPLRVFDAGSGRAAFTVDCCKDVLQIVPDNRFCEGVTPVLGPFDPASPFKGALRAVHFKSLFVFGNSALDAAGRPRPQDFCTDPLGRAPTEIGADGECASDQVRQKLRPFDGSNLWTAWTNPSTQVTGGVSGSLYVLDQPLRYPYQPEAGAAYQLVSGPLPLPGQAGLTGLFAPTYGGGQSGTGCPIVDVTYHVPGDPTDAGGNVLPLDAPTLQARKDHAYCPVGIGHEKIVDNRGESIQGPN